MTLDLRWAFVTLLVASCDIIYGLDRPPEPPDAPPPGPDIATASFRRYIHTPAGVVTMPSTEDATAEVVLENGARPEVVRDGDDFRFAWTKGMTYHLTVHRPGRGPLEYISKAEHLQEAHRELVRPDAVVPAPGTRLDVTMIGLVGTNTTYVMTTGVWAMIGKSGPMIAEHTIDWTQPQIFLTGRPRLLDPTDTIHCAGFGTVFDPSGLMYEALDREGSLQQAMVSGAPTALMCMLASRPLDRCARIASDRVAEMARVAGAAAQTFNNDSWGTIVLAVPEPSFGPFSSLWLADSQGTGPITPFSGNLHYANPFADHDAAVLTSVVRYRNVLAPGATTGLNLSAGTSGFYALADNCGAVTPPAQISMPSPPAIGGVELLTDIQLHLSNTQPIAVSWEDRLPGPVDFYIVTLSRLAVVDGATALQEVKAWITTGNEVEIERDLLESGPQYMISIASLYMAPGAADGDFVTLRWPSPVATGTNYSSVFTVAP